MAYDVYCHYLSSRSAFYTLVPKRVIRNRKDGHVRARDDGDDTLLLDKQPNKRIKLSGSQSQSMLRTRTSEALSTQRQASKVASDDSDTEPEDDEQDLLLNQSKPGGGATSKGEKPSPTNDQNDEDDEYHLLLPPTPSESPLPPEDDGHGRIPGRIIGTAHPLEDFRSNLASGDLVTKAVEDLAFVIRTVLLRPFSAKRIDEMLECATALRKVCLEVRASNVTRYAFVSPFLRSPDRFPIYSCLLIIFCVCRKTRSKLGTSAPVYCYPQAGTIYI